MKIALVSPGYPPTVGGIETLVEALAEGLADRGHEVAVWTHRRSPEERIVPGGDEVRGVRIHRFVTTRSQRFGLSPALWAHVRRHGGDVDLIHAHSYHSTAALSALLAPRRVPVVYSPHFHGGGHTFLARMLHHPYRVIAARLIARTASFITVSEAEKRLLVESFPSSRSRARVVHNAVEIADIHAATPFPDEPPTLLVLGRVERYKRIDTIIEAFEAVAEPSQLVIVGDGPDRDRIAELAAQSRRSKDIRLLGFISREDVRRWLRTARGVVSLSEHEAFGIVALEGAAAGARILLSDLPAHREVLSMLPDGTVTIHGSDPLSADLDALLAQPNAGPQLVRDWSAVVDEHLDVYADVVAAAH